MTNGDIRALRLANEQLNSTKFKTASQLVEWFGAVQSQDFAGAKWALGQRLGLNDYDLEKEFNEGKILRTHVMRPTWHFVHPKDILWMEDLTSPRVNQAMNYYSKRLGLDREFLDKTNKIIVKALTGGKFLKRSEIAKTLEENGIPLKTQKLGHVVSQAELDGIICSGPRIGKQFTYALISERTAKLTPLTPKDPLAELAKRFFQSHGPATIKDFVWWSGLTTVDARKGVEANKFKSEIVDGKTYFFYDLERAKPEIPDDIFLLPNYDEYTIAYKDRDSFLPPAVVKYFHNQGNASFWNAIVYRGEIIGMWKRTYNKSAAVIHTQLFKKLSKDENDKLKKEARKYGNFFNIEASIK